MGVLNFSSPLQRQTNTSLNILQFEDHDPTEYDGVEHSINIPSRTKRKRAKYGVNTTYDFRDYGVDKRRNGSKHKRRREHFSDLLELVGDELIDDEFRRAEDCRTVFAELFLDESKMKLWEGFINLSEENQRSYLEHSPIESALKADDSEMVSHEETCYLSIDQKIRDMLRSKQLAKNGLLEYYENDMMSCLEETFPSVLVLQLNEKYDRMLIYAICQYFSLFSNTIRLKGSTLVEIEINEKLHSPPGLKLTEYMRTMNINKTGKAS